MILLAKTYETTAKMELIFPSVSYLVSSLLILLLSLLSFRFLEKKVTRFASKLPPGPWTLPFIGNLHLLITAKLIHHNLRDLAEFYGPIMLLRAGETDIVVITSPEAAKEVMKIQDSNFANRPVISAAKVFMYGGTDIAFSNGSYWRQIRRICITEVFISKRVKSFFLIRQEEINSMLKTFSLETEESPVNLSAKTSELSNNIIIRAAFGGLCKDRGLFLGILREVLELLTGFDLPDLFPSLSWLDVNMKRRLARLHRKLDFVLEGIVQEHLKKREQQKKGGNEFEFDVDLVDVLINVKERGDLEEPITMDNVKAVIMDIFSGATDTSSTTITWAMAELIRHPQVMAKAQAEIRQAASKNTKIEGNSLSYLKLVIKETLRLHPAAPLLVPRVCNKSCQVLGYTIPSGARVLINAWALGRHPDYWHNPEEFIPERFEVSNIDFKGHNFEFVPFGSGRRICPGLEFGLAVVEETLAMLLLHFDWKLPHGMKPDDVDMTETLGSVSAKKMPLYLIPILRVPLSDVSI